MNTAHDNVTLAPIISHIQAKRPTWTKERVLRIAKQLEAALKENEDVNDKHDATLTQRIDALSHKLGMQKAVSFPKSCHVEDLDPIPLGGEVARDSPAQKLRSRLASLLHSSKCLASHCEVPTCNDTKELLRHLASCNCPWNCPVQHCSSSRAILAHHSQCQDSSCPLCSSPPPQGAPTPPHPATVAWQQAQIEHRALLQESQRERRRKREAEAAAKGLAPKKSRLDGGPGKASQEEVGHFKDAQGNVLGGIGPGFFVQQALKKGSLVGGSIIGGQGQGAVCSGHVDNSGAGGGGGDGGKGHTRFEKAAAVATPSSPAAAAAVPAAAPRPSLLRESSWMQFGLMQAALGDPNRLPSYSDMSNLEAQQQGGGAGVSQPTESTDSMQRLLLQSTASV
ncbi:unnamed protein product [Chrysoparadoxa australica]